MKKINTIRSLSVLLMGCLMFSNIWAAPMSEASIPEARALQNDPLRFGDYEVYYSAFNSTFITPDIARVYGLERSPKHGLVNIAIRNIKDSETGKAVTAQLQGQHKNLLQQSVPLQFKEVREGSAVYYLAGFKFSNEEMLEFSIDVKPEGSDTRYPVTFRQTFYQDGK